MYNEKKNPALPLYWLGFQRLKGTLLRSVFGLLEPFSIMNKNTNTEQWQGKRTRGDKKTKKPKTSYQIKSSQLIQKISKKQGAAVASLK